ncbi:hypothetical protein FRUB_04757 [Fimbriiglobus ruber]|uniref:Transposase IS4-like domain-containing protein n=1 Tax=Fimbriiglobus ruber TaxID=1908690 RepID=A0A225DX17_9BACT|nr:hypothetical protein FRUB_04757 [Fimbriiglobus ruber]
MDAAAIYQRFVEQAPAAVLIHGLIQSCMSPEFLDQTAAPHLPTSPNPRQLAFADLVEILLPVVFGSATSVRHSYRQATHLHAVATLKCVYERFDRTPPAAVAALVGAVADRVGPLFDTPPTGPLRFRTLDGNHLAATQNRLADLAGRPAPLPGQAIVLRDQATGVFVRALLHEDGHANERALHAQLLPAFEPGDVVIADSSFCTEGFLTGVRARGAASVVRHHGGVGLTPLGDRIDHGVVPTGRVYETRVQYAQTALVLRLVEIERCQPTREGITVVGVLTDVPAGPGRGGHVPASADDRGRIPGIGGRVARGGRYARVPEGRVVRVRVGGRRVQPLAGRPAGGRAPRGGAGRADSGPGVPGPVGARGAFVRRGCRHRAGREPRHAYARVDGRAVAGMDQDVGPPADRRTVCEEQTRSSQSTTQGAQSPQGLTHRDRPRARTTTHQKSIVTAVGQAPHSKFLFCLFSDPCLSVFIRG